MAKPSDAPFSAPNAAPSDKPATPGRPGQPPGAPGQLPGTPGQPAGAPAQPSGTPAQPGQPSKPDDPLAPKQRPPKPPTPPNPDELKVRADEHGKIRFNFRGQPWLDVLNWLAEVSEMSLDWTELPADFLNLTTQRSYTVEEARDLVNRHLLARGFTLLENGEVLNVVNLKKLDTGLVPRVQPSDLLKRRPNEFVKVSFALEWLVAEAAVEELKPMLSPNGKLSALKSTNRIEAIDTVVNLRDIYKVLGDEQSNDGQERLVREFELQHAKASEVAQQLQKLLGIEDKSAARGAGGGQMNPEQQQQMMMQQQQMMQQMQQQGRGGGGGMPGGPKQAAEISLVVNARRNSVLALAPPDKIAIITQAVRMLDVPTERGHSLLANLGRMQVYRLAQLDPAALVKMLEESGGLDPTTRLQIDNSNKAIIAHASLADHMLVRQVIEKLDGSGRKFEVIQLRRLEADHVAGTIEFMMSGSGEDKSQQSSRRYDYYDYFGGGGRGGRQETEKEKFRVDADVENNRLLLWANGIELEEVNNLLVKLGEIPDRQGKASTTRVLNVEPGPELDEMLDKLRRVWPSLAPNPLLLPEGREPLPPKSTEPTKSKAVEPPGDAPVRPAARSRSAEIPREPASPKIVALTTIPIVQLAPLEPTLPAEDTLPADDEPPAKPREVGNDVDADAPPQRRRASETANAPPPPVRISIAPDGRIVVSSQDPAALDLIEEIAASLAPERKDYHVFKLKNAPAYWVKLSIQDFFEEEDKDKSSRNRGYYFSDFPPPAKQESKRRLSKRKPLKFISESDTNTILVQGADPAQLKIIKELIELYDQPEPTNAKAARITTVVPVKWSKAQIIADAVKDVYRDLLSSLDKALAQNPDQKARPQSQNTYIFGGEDEEGGKDKKTPVTFKGKLSIGVDELSNTLLVSAEGENLLANVTKMIRSLDEAAKPSTTMQVMKVNGGINSTHLKKALADILSEPLDKRRGAPNAPGQPGQPGRGVPRQQPSGGEADAGM